MNAPVAVGAEVTRIPPPLMFAVPFLAGVLLHQVLPWSTGLPRLLGAPVLAAGVGLVLWAVSAVHRAGTTIVPHLPVTTLLTSGPFALSRNPMYTGLAVAVVGGGPLVGTWWAPALLPVSLVVVRLGVIRPEEQYLLTRFGQRYSDYCASVRRWA